MVYIYWEYVVVLSEVRPYLLQDDRRRTRAATQWHGALSRLRAVRRRDELSLRFEDGGCLCLSNLMCLGVGREHIQLGL